MNVWQQFFDRFADRYDREEFTHNTQAEVRFILEHLRPPAGGRILDLGCGTGRHSVALAQQGLQVTGVDLSPGMLAVARRRAEAANVAVEWVQSDATTFTPSETYDAVICLCEGAMCLLSGDEDALVHDQQILGTVTRALRPGGRFLLNVLNACRQIRAFNDADVASGRFNVLDLTETSLVSELLPDFRPDPPPRERGYTPPELRRMLLAAGLEVRGIHGGTAGDWGLRPPKLDEMELMALAEKPV
jgi:SAM-dependent methyltransferase